MTDEVTTQESTKSEEELCDLAKLIDGAASWEEIPDGVTQAALNAADMLNIGEVK